MRSGGNLLFALGRWIVVLFHVSLCATVSLAAIATTYMVAEGNVRLQLDEPWDSMLFYATYGIWFVVFPCWGGFCLGFAVLLRRRGHAGSFKQIQTLFGISIPIFGLAYYDKIVRGLTHLQTEGVG
jgi:hypothetical protein